MRSSFCMVKRLRQSYNDTYMTPFFKSSPIARRNATIYAGIKAFPSRGRWQAEGDCFPLRGSLGSVPSSTKKV